MAPSKSKTPKASAGASVCVEFNGPSEYLIEPDTGQRVARGDAAEFPDHIAARLLADQTISVTTKGKPNVSTV